MVAKNITIAIGNQKGGVGKTTSTACIGAALALQGRRVLLIDLDAQQNLTFTLTQNEDPETSIYDTLVKDQSLPIVPIRENLDLVPASLDLARAEIDMATMMAREGILKSYLDEQKEKYDYILMDCSPSLGIVTTNALVAADELYIPLTVEALPLKGLTMLDDIVREVKRRVNPMLELGGVFFTRFNNRKLNREVISMVEKRYGEKVFQTRIRENISIAEMPLSGQTIFEYEPKSNGAADYQALVDEIISREENR
ncbi:ParA family protein [Bacteroides uniformis]|uniref:ParA family protein n=1 Tax=Bacteroides uniformis TaxID=820 RepID=UPI001899E3B5|nr:ParA family protein [Bacteroides uniformis]